MVSRLALLIGSVALSQSVAADPWQISITGNFVSPDGETTLSRPNGKLVSTDIDSSAGFSLELGYDLGARSTLTLSYAGSAKHKLTIHQDFPDGSDFSSSDNFRMDTISLGWQYKLVPSRGFNVYLEPNLTYVHFSDVYLESAGPPFDREAPLDFEIDEQLGLGLTLGLDVPLGTSNWSMTGTASVMVFGFEGRTTPDPNDPGFDSGIDLDFNALSVGLGMTYDF